MFHSLPVSRRSTRLVGGDSLKLPPPPQGRAARAVQVLQRSPPVFWVPPGREHQAREACRSEGLPWAPGAAPASGERGCARRECAREKCERGNACVTPGR